ncbi:MAG: phosphonate C-P lyase system protein PhnH [Betaproteobacteria bacterium]|nr:phosphonate C-P lyase system protein PhnH [Betaproteobacteria bacterium]
MLERLPFPTNIRSARTDWLPAAQQAAFRQIMKGFAYPGRLGRLDTEAEHALPLLLATLVDRSNRLADPRQLLAADEYRRLGSRASSPESAQFVVLPGICPPDFQPMLGSLENPEQGATLIVVAERLAAGAGLRLSGPGIDGAASVAVQGIDPLWWQKREQWNAGFPLGVDMIVVAGRQVLGLPRTVRIDTKGDN